MSGKISIALFFFCLVAVLAKAQPFNSARGEFTVNAIRGCAPLAVTISNPDCNATTGCAVIYQPNGAYDTIQFENGDPAIVYNLPGTYFLYLVEGSLGKDSVRIEVFQNTPPEFDVYRCTGNQVSVKLKDLNYDNYIIDFNDATAPVTASPGVTQNHTYATAGAKTVSVRGRNNTSADNCVIANKPVNIIPVVAPAIDEVSVTPTDDIALTFGTLETFYLHKLEVATNGATSFQQLPQTVTTSTHAVNNLNPALNYYCFRLAILNGCTNGVMTRSNTLCSIKLDVTAENNQNRLTWSTYAPAVNSYTLERNSAAIPAPAAASTSHVDTDVQCGVKYRYQLTALSGASRSISNLDSAIAFSTNTPAPIENISAVLGQAGVDLFWEAATGFTPKDYVLYKTVNGETFTVAVTDDLQANDPNFTIENPACYFVSYEDVCDNQSDPGTTGCPMVASAALQTDNTIDLSWTRYEGWENGVDFYTIEIFDATGQSVGTVVTNDTSYHHTGSADNQVYMYVITATPNDALTQSVSNRVMVIKSPQIHQPSAFTPNNDRLNDLFMVKANFITHFEMSIYNRWGELMFSTTDLDVGWDGTFRGDPAPEGTYTFVAELTDEAGRTFHRSGNVILLRKSN